MAGRQDGGVEMAGPVAADGRTDGRMPPGVDLQPLADVIAGLTRENRELAAAASLWQERASMLQGRLLARGAGDDAPPGDATAGSAVASMPPATEGAAWRRWLRRLTEGTP